MFMRQRSVSALLFSNHFLDVFIIVLTELWTLICSVFEPWICSQDSPIPG